MKNALLGTSDRRRLLRHPKIKELLELSSPLSYDLSLLWPAKATPPQDEVGAWLGTEYNPFALARAEWEPRLPNIYFELPRIMELMQAPHMAWIYGAPGSGRTVLAFYTLLQMHRQNETLPLYLTLDAPAQFSEMYVLEKLLHTLVNAWENVLNPELEKGAYFNGPVAFLDLPYHQQKLVTQLLLWEFGDLSGIYTWLRSLGVNLKSDKAGQVLKSRLDTFARIGLSPQMSRPWLLRLIAARPAGLHATYIMVEWEGATSALAAHTLLRLAEALQKESVYLKILALKPPPRSCPQGALSWDRDALAKLLAKRLTEHGLSITEDCEKLLLDFTVANGALPRIMIGVINQALRQNLQRDSQSDILSPDIDNGPSKELTLRDICDAIHRAQPTYAC